MIWSHLTQADWDDFNRLFPGAWSWLQHKLQLREMQHLESLQARNPWQEKRLAELRSMVEFLQSLHKS